MRLTIMVSKQHAWRESSSILDTCSLLQRAGVEVLPLVGEGAGDQLLTGLSEHVGRDAIEFKEHVSPWSRKQHRMSILQTLADFDSDAVLLIGETTWQIAGSISSMADLPLVPWLDSTGSTRTFPARLRPRIRSAIATSSVIAGIMEPRFTNATIKVVPPPIDPDRLDQSKTTAGSGRGLSMVVLDGSGPVQQIEPMLDAVKGLLEQVENLQMFFELPGRSGHAAWNLLSRHGLLEHVTAIDRIGPLEALLADGDVLVAPRSMQASRSIVARSMLQAMSVVAIRDGTLDCLEHEGPVILKDEPSKALWEQAIAPLLLDAQVRMRHAADCRKAAAIEHEPDRCINGILEAAGLSIRPATLPFKTQSQD
ncbi:MAG: hypothetical protein CMJ32_07170 [Phycisphaerae bacterium]|nr:hypothetical protein [Phycisphaerae bacterium]